MRESLVKPVTISDGIPQSDYWGISGGLHSGISREPQSIFRKNKW